MIVATAEVPNVSVAQFYRAQSREGRAVIRGSEESPYIWIAGIEIPRSRRVVYALCISNREGIAFVRSNVLMKHMTNLIAALVTRGAFGLVIGDDGSNEGTRE